MCYAPTLFTSQGPGDLGFSHCVVRVSSSTTVLFAYKWVRERARLFCKQTAVALTLGEGGATPCLFSRTLCLFRSLGVVHFGKISRQQLRCAVLLFIFFRDSASRTFIYLFVLQKLAFLNSSRTAARGTWARGNICHFARSPTAGAKVQPRALSGEREMWWPV